MAQDEMRTPPQKRRGRGLRVALIAVAALVVIVVGGAAIAIASFDPNSLKPRIAAAVKQATGRDLAIKGAIGLKWSLRPTIALHDVTLSNPPGFSRPNMATLQELDLQLALLPLLHKSVQIDRLALVQPDFRLETDAKGRNNWQFTPETQAPAAAPSQPAASQPSEPVQISVREVQVSDGTIALRDDRTGKVTTIGVRSLTATSDGPIAPMHLEAQATANGAPFSVVGDTGPLARLQDPAATTPWPVKLTLQASGARATADGTITQPLAGKGYKLALDGNIPDLAALDPLLPRAKLPPLHDVRFSAKVADSGKPIPAISALKLQAGQSDLSSLRKGLRLESLDVAAPALDQPATARAVAKAGDTPVTVTATLGSPARLLPGAQGPLPIEFTAESGGARLTGKGSVADPEALRGVALDLAATVPDLSQLSPLAPQPLPPVKSIAFQGRLTDAKGGFAKGATLQGMTLTSSAGDAKGDVSVGFGVPLSITAALTSNRIDVDALSAAQGKPMPEASGKPTTPNAPATPPPPAPARERNGRLFSDQPLPFGLLQLVNADVRLKIGVLHIGGRDTKDIDAHVVLRDGKLQADPLAATLQSGRLEGKLSADAGQKAPPVALVLHAPGMAVRTLLAAAGLPDWASGDLEIYADLRGAGESPHAIAASLSGNLGLAMANGSIDNRLLSMVLGPVLQKANIPDVLNRGGLSDIRCFAARLDLQNGVGTFRTLALSSSLLTMDGGGSVNLGAETLALRLRPQARIGGTGLVIPLRIDGPIRSPGVAMDPVGAAEANAGTVAGAFLGGATPLGLLGALGADKVLDHGTSQACAGPLAVARGQPAPATPAPAPSSSGGGQKAPDPAALLRQLFR